MLIFLHRKIVIPRQLLTFLPRKEATLSWQLLPFLLVKESVSPQQSLIFLPRKIAIPRQLLTFLCRKEAILSWQLLPFLLGKVAILLQLSLPLGKETILPPKQVNPIIKIGQSGKVSGSLTGTGQPRLPRRTALSPRMTIPPLPHQLDPQGSSNEDPNLNWVINLSSKPLTPAQRSVLAKGPNYAVTPRQPPNLEYITAIEAACTKLSQQDAEELKANINRVLRSSHPPNLI